MTRIKTVRSIRGRMEGDSKRIAIEIGDDLATRATSAARYMGETLCEFCEEWISAGVKAAEDEVKSRKVARRIRAVYDAHAALSATCAKSRVKGGVR